MYSNTMVEKISLAYKNAPELVNNPLPQLLQTPSGLALLEIQGTINLPASNDAAEVGSGTDQDYDRPQLIGTHTESKFGSLSEGLIVGRLSFPDYDENDAHNTAWMKKVHMYVGSNQRLTGEIKKLQKAIAVVQKTKPETTDGSCDVDEDENSTQLEIVEIVKYKLVFASRPEPVNNQILEGL